MNSQPIRVAAVNAAPVTGDVAANLGLAARWCEQAADANVDLLVFPEAFTTGYDPAYFESATLPNADDLVWLEPLQQVIDRTGTVVLLNSALHAGDGRKSLTTIVLRPFTAAQPVYDKQHLYPLEVETFTAGDVGTTVAFGGHDLALSVCYDVDFPEHAAAAAADGATVYVNSGAYFPGSEMRRDLRYAARALDNGIYVIFSGLTGDFAGGSAIYDPLGQPVVRFGQDEGLAIAAIDPEMVEQARESQRAWADRRPALGSRHHYELDQPPLSSTPNSSTPNSSTPNSRCTPAPHRAAPRANTTNPDRQTLR